MWLLQSLGWTVGVLIALGALGCVYEGITSFVDRKRLRPPGELIDVGGYRLHLHAMGQGSGPTVVIETGRFNPTVMWTEARDQIAEFVRVVSYDRAGYAWSDPATTARSGHQVTRDLHTLLLGANIPGPYILVGHSLGGMYVRLFAERYPAEVAGVVLVDAYTEDEVLRQPPRLKKLQMSYLRVINTLARFGIVRLLVHLYPSIIGEDAKLLERFPRDLKGRIQAFLSHARLWASVRAEWSYLDDLVAQLQVAKGFGDKPLIVLSRGKSGMVAGGGFSDADIKSLWQLQQEVQAGLTRLSSRSRHVIVEESGHAIQLERPDAVATAVREILGMVE